MKRKFLAVFAIFAVTLLPAMLSYAASGEEIIKNRVAFMEDEIGGQWKILAAFAKNGTGSLSDVEKAANELAKLSEKISGHFPKDTGRGKFPDKMTRALPVIWTDVEGFKKDIQTLSAGSNKLASLAKSGDKENAIEMIGTSGSYARTKIGCAECHKTFRGDRVK